MKIIDKMIESLMEEVEGAQEYAEKFVENKARGDINRANRFKEMSHDELKHAGYIRDLCIVDLDELKKVYTMTDAEEEAWERACRCANEKMAIIRHMLAM